MDQINREKLYSQIQDEYGKITYTYTTHLKEAQLLQKRNRAFKWVQIMLSAFSSAAFIGLLIKNQKWVNFVGTIVSTSSVIINSYLKDLDQSSEANKHLEISKDLRTVRNKYLSLLTDFNSLSSDEIRNQRDKLQKETDLIFKEELTTSKKAYEMARMSLKKQDEQFFSQEELNKMLPEHLRKGD